jgi:hypothetical protein
MKKSRRNTWFASAAALAMLGALSSAPARADALSEISGSYSGHFNNMEDFYNPTTGANGVALPTVGDQNYGLILLGSVSSSSGGVYGGPGTGDYLVGVFGGITVGAVYNSSMVSQPSFGPGDTAYATGGVFHIYEIPQADFASTAAFNAFIKATNPATGFTAGCGTQTLAEVAAGTSFCYNGLTNKAGVKDVLDFTLQNSYDISGNDYTLASSLSGNITGTATSWADVTGGVDAGQFENASEFAGGTSPYAIGTLTDISLIDDFCPEVAGCASLYSGTPDTHWSVASSDPFNGVTVPEPFTLSLFGAGLVGAAALRRRKKAKA